MSSTILRLGLWILLIVMAAYVIRETYEDSPVHEYISAATLQRSLLVGVALIGIGIVTSFLEKAARKVATNRCARCQRPIPRTAIYCSQHLRQAVQIEHERTHSTRPRRT